MVPQFGRAEDAEALAVYRRLGFRTIGLDARSVAHKGRGAIHCLTMNYPRVPLREHLP
jgi:agmatine/peptidylarginine deiminase